MEVTAPETQPRVFSTELSIETERGVYCPEICGVFEACDLTTKACTHVLGMSRLQARYLDPVTAVTSAPVAPETAAPSSSPTKAPTGTPTHPAMPPASTPGSKTDSQISGDGFTKPENPFSLSENIGEETETEGLFGGGPLGLLLFFGAIAAGGVYAYYSKWVQGPQGGATGFDELRQNAFEVGDEEDVT